MVYSSKRSINKRRKGYVDMKEDSWFVVITKILIGLILMGATAISALYFIVNWMLNHFNFLR